MSSISGIFGQRYFSLITVLISLALNLSITCIASAQSPSSPPFARAKDRVTSFIDEDRRVTLEGNVHPQAIAQYDIGAVPSGFLMQEMILTLLPDASQESALNELLQVQSNPESPYYHQWLTPEQYAESFGISEADVNQVVRWLETHGFKAEEVTAGRRSIIFSGSAAQVQEAFHTAIHTYNVGGQLHHANVADPQIPAALAPVVGGVVSLHDFYSEPLHNSLRKASPEFTSGGSHYLAPADFATIYDVNPLYQQSINGSGQTIAIVGRSNIHLADITRFRAYFGLPANSPQIIVNGSDPGDLGGGEETEADLDLEWSGAVAKNATVKFVVSQSTNSSDGVDLSAQYIVNHNVASVMSTSFSLCEHALGSSGNNFFNSLWQQAAAEGIIVLVAAGDSGAAGCDSPESTRATGGLAVNGLCSTIYSTCVGGTEFNDAANPSLYWAASNAAGTQNSAVTYIPEVEWNESGPSSGLWSSGGGASALYSKPAWQGGTGVPADGRRDIPDVSLAAAGHDGYLIVQGGTFYDVGGTSASSPSFAGVMALLVQHRAAREGNVNSVLYELAAKQRSGGAAVFHDITSRNNSVPGQPGYNAVAGYDQATGLGSVDAAILVEHWSDGIVVPAFQLTSSENSLLIAQGASNSVTIDVATSGGFSAAVALSATGLPSGVTATFAPPILFAPGTVSSSLRIHASASATSGTYSVTIAAAGSSVSHSLTLALTVYRAPDFTVSSSATSFEIGAGHSGNLTITTSPNSAFDSAVTLSVTGLPPGVTTQFMPSAVVAAPGEAVVPLSFAVASGVAANSYPITVIASGGGITQRISLTLHVPGLSFH